MTVLVTVLQGTGPPGMTHQSTDLLEGFDSPGMEAEKSQDQQAGDPGEPMVYVLVQAQVQRQEKIGVPTCSLSEREIKFFLTFVLLRPPIHGCGSPTEGRDICFTQSTDSNVSLIQKQLRRATQNYGSLIIWAPCGPVRLKHKTDHHNDSEKFQNTKRERLVYILLTTVLRPTYIFLKIKTICEHFIIILYAAERSLVGQLKNSL